jgi:hypothetical protein
MRFYTLLFILFSFVISSCAANKQYCELKNISKSVGDKEKSVFRSAGYEWLSDAMVCKMGEFEVATPSKNEDDENTLFVFRKGKPVFYRNTNGTLVFSPKLIDASFEKIIVQIWHGNDNEDIERIRYQTVGKNPEVMSYDTDFDGQADIKTIYESGKIVEIYTWEDNMWKPKR